MKKILTTLAIGIFLIMPVSSSYAYEAHYGRTEVIYYDKAKAYNGYTLFTPGVHPMVADTTYLIDMEGNFINSWTMPEGYTRCGDAYLMDNGNLLGAIRTLTGDRIHRQGDGIVQEYDWDGNVLWEVDSYALGRGQHHDLHRIWNKKLGEYTTIMIVGKTLTEADAIALGADPSKLGAEGVDGYPDGIIEVDMNGNIIWEWHLIDHTIQDFDPTKPNFGVIADHPEKHDINYGRGLLDGDWVHLNSLHYNEGLDHIVANGVSFGEFYVIDHGNTFIADDPEGSIAKAKGPDGDLIFRWGNPLVYDQGDYWTQVDNVYTAGHQQMYNAHDVEWIDEGLPGAGHFLIFDNGTYRGWERDTYSEILEIDPYDENGNYVPLVEAGYSGTNNRSNQIVWSYKSQSPTSFYSRYISSNQRLPNGNTLVCSGAQGHFFEVTYDEKEVVWEYVNPVCLGGVLKLMPDNTGSYNAVFRCHRYAPDHAAFAGKDMSPKGKFTERAGVEALQDKLEAFMAQ